ncbi:hypothetical protein [Paramagnetospirillum kuznetsovii]|nr:hypothetical protein [Paramagnetospirillum kuznetsovii]
MPPFKLRQTIDPASSAHPDDLVETKTALNRLGHYTPPTGVIDVAAHDRSSPGGGTQAWKGKSNEAFRQKIAESEQSADKPNNGYGEEHDTSHALGRYQLMRDTLKQIGWKENGRWTDKARREGVATDQDFKTNPEAQEKALTEAMRDYERQAKAKGALDQAGKTYTGTDGKPVMITEGGIVAASHREGAGATHAYLARRAAGRIAKDSKVQASDIRIQKRLRDYQSAPYHRGEW